MKRAGVLLAALGLVVAVFVSLRLSQSLGGGRAEPPAPAVRDFGEVPGFRTDAWYLPDEELLGFVEISEGPFLMGSDPAVDTAAFDLERWSADEPRGRVDLPTFYVGRYEVTVAQYSAFVAVAAHPVADAQAISAPADHPVGSVAWTDALAYTRWLHAELASSPRTPAALRELIASGWRVALPSEAEWEKAARGSDGRTYPWGPFPRQDRANFLSGRPTPVGTYGCPECPFEVYDLAGNVWEWTRSPYQPYPYDESDDHEDMDAEALWIMRGGSYGEPPHFVRAANRGGADPGARRPFIGFRIVLTPPA